MMKKCRRRIEIWLLLIVCLLLLSACNLAKIGADNSGVQNTAEMTAENTTPMPTETDVQEEEDQKQTEENDPDAVKEQPAEDGKADSGQTVTGSGTTEKEQNQGINSLIVLPVWSLAAAGFVVIMIFAVIMLYLSLLEKMQNNSDAIDETNERIAYLNRTALREEQPDKLRLAQIEAKLSGCGRVRIEKRGEIYAWLPTEENNWLRLIVEKQERDYVLKTKKPDPVVISVMIVFAGIRSFSLSVVEEKSDLWVKLRDIDSYTGELMFERESITEEYIEQSSLDYFFDFQNIPAFPSSCGVKIEKPAIVVRSDDGFILKQKGIIFGEQH